MSHVHENLEGSLSSTRVPHPVPAQAPQYKFMKYSLSLDRDTGLIFCAEPSNTLHVGAYSESCPLLCAWWSSPEVATCKNTKKTENGI